MEAITSHRCLESYSYERLELLGDSFLKYAISQHIFMKYESEDEGQLAIRRTDAVNNKTLHDLALERNLQVLKCYFDNQLINLNREKYISS